jgi:hypothetical protein
LSQIQNEEEVVIAYSSRHLNAAEKNYSAIEREALAIVYGVKRYRHYLQDEKFESIKFDTNRERNTLTPTASPTFES